MASEPSVPLAVDGVECAGSEGQTILEVAASRGIRIPTLCKDPRLPPDASCWVCVVEVRQGGQWRVEPACSTGVAPGMEIRTESEQITRSRRWALELLLSDHYADCVAPCELACPAGVKVPAYVAAVAGGNFEQAIAIIRQTNPLPSVCGRVCSHPCESACHRTSVDAPLAINNLKRLATDACLAGPGLPAAKAGPETGRRVAIVGAGPAGLSAAYFLRQQGHGVTLYDGWDQAGGMLRHGIPAYRLPRAVLDADIDAIARMGVELVLGRRLGEHFTLEQLRAQGYGAVYLALGAWKGQRLNIPGEEAEGTVPGVPFLAQVSRGELTRLAGRVAVVGGGNTAVDAARTAARLGASSVTILYRRDRAQMPAYQHEVAAAEAEGVQLRCLVAPLSVETKQGRVRAVKLQRMALGPPDASGRPRPVPIADSEFLLEIDWLIRGVGEEPEPPASEPLLAAHRRGAEDLVLVGEGVFAGGDFASGPSSAVQAIAAGRRASQAIDGWLREGQVRARPVAVLSRKRALAPEDPSDFAHVERRARAPVPEHPQVGRARDFGEVEQGYAAQTGKDEATRCLQCGCSSFDGCELRLLMQEYGIPQSRLRGTVQRHRPVTLRPGLVLDMNKCIRCARCVRICREVVGAEALSFIRRGFDARILFSAEPGTERRRSCDTCVAQTAACAQSCPTGALTLEGR